MSIPLITNFTINQNAPIDDRIIVTNSSAKDSIQYKYDGLTIFQTSDRSSWTWNATSATWSYNVSGNGIYAGSGSIVSNTYVNFGNISTGASANTTSNLLGYYSNLIGVSNIYYLNTFAVKKTGSPTSPLSFKIQNSLNSTNYSYIEFNPDSTDIGSIAIGNNATEYLRISNTGNLNLWKGNLILWSPTYSITFNTSYLGANNIYYLPNNSGTLAMISDVNTLAATVSTLAATVSAISLQTVSNVGATTSKPVTMSSSLSVGSTFSVGIVSSSTGGNIIANSTRFTYLNSSTYILEDLFYISKSATPTTSPSSNITSITVPNSCNIFVEVIFNSSCTAASTLYVRQSKIIGSFTSNSTGTITQIGSTTTAYSASNDGLNSYFSDYGSFTALSGAIQFNQGLNSILVPPHTTFSYKINVNYRFYITPTV